MRRGSRGGGAVLEFGGSGEDSFVAVVVTKLTGALLFILLLAMVIMALLPKADAPDGDAPSDAGPEAGPLEIATPGHLPEAIAGRPYELALAASGARGALRWSLGGPLPEGLSFDPDRGLIRGTPTAGTSGARRFSVHVFDGDRSAARAVSLVVFDPESPLTMASRLAHALPRVPWVAWMEHGFGFVVLLLVHMVAINGVAAMERRARAIEPGPDVEEANRSNRTGRRFVYYRLALRLATASAAAALAAWLWLHRAGDDGRPGTPSAIAAERVDGRNVLR